MVVSALVALLRLSKKLEHLIRISFSSVLIMPWDFISATFFSNWNPRYGLTFKKSSTLVVKISMLDEAEQSSC